MNDSDLTLFWLFISYGVFVVDSVYFILPIYLGICLSTQVPLKYSNVTDIRWKFE